MATLCFVGQTVLDQVYAVPGFSAVGGKQVATAFHNRVGGLAANAALAAQRLKTTQNGFSTRLISAVGDDTIGAALQRLLGPLADSVAVVAGARSSVSAVLLIASGERQVHNFRGDALQRAPLPRPADFEHCAGVLADPRWIEGAAVALAHARAVGLTSVFDAEVADAAVLRRLAPLAEWSVFSRSGLCAWAGASDGDNADPAALQTLLDAVAATAPRTELLVTLGAAGAMWRRSDGRTTHHPAFAVEVRDSNGAGDVMHGALLLSLAEGRPPADAVRRSMAAAAMACLGPMPTRAELDRFLETAR